MGKWALNKSDAIRIISKEIEKVVGEFQKPKFIFPTYTDIEIFFDSKEKEIIQNRFIFVGQIIHLKGIDTLIDAVSIAKEKHTKLEVLIIGSGEEKGMFANRVKTLKLDNEFIFLGNKTQGEIADFIHSSIALILPSITEGLPRVILEAFACSRPAIASCVGGIPELIIDGETGLLIQPADPESLAEKILFAFNNKGKMKIMGLNGKNFVEENFSTIKFAENYFQMIEKTLGQKIG
ncbi:MAG: glycosyltransferase family 4 protein [Candidatus Aureabacteria bacterium]|nr:glycosyltransferase family 4 protein [Candidatus Auribacterota bacterium]